jgi:ABC-type uncharacterized transport system substrate-binding protein
MKAPLKCWSASMFDAVRRLWLGVTLIAATSAFLLLSDWKHRRAGDSAIQRVAVLQFSSLAALEDGVNGMLDQLRENGYANGPKIVIDRFNAENDLATANSMAREITSGKYGYVFSISTNCLQAVANATRWRPRSGSIGTTRSTTRNTWWESAAWRPSRRSWNSRAA